jgi:hypothetical protein
MKLRIELCVMAILFFSRSGNSQGCISYSDSSFLTKEAIDYIYNRSLDFTLKDKKSTRDYIGLFYHEDSEKYESIKITIDPITTIQAFKAIYVQEIYNKSLKVHPNKRILNENGFINSFEIHFVHWEEPPELEGNHLVHVRFSPILYHGNRLFIGVHCLNQFSTTEKNINYDTYLIYEAEHCRNGVICFRRIYIPLGFNLTGEKTYTSLEIEDRPCSFK